MKNSQHIKYNSSFNAKAFFVLKSTRLVKKPAMEARKWGSLRLVNDLLIK